jgi:hypothetical protein
MKQVWHPLIIIGLLLCIFEISIQEKKYSFLKHLGYQNSNIMDLGNCSVTENKNKYKNY